MENLIERGKRVIRERRENRGELSDSFLNGFEEGVAEMIAFLTETAASDVLEQLTDNYPAIFELDDNAEATGTVAVYCSTECRGKDSPEFELLAFGESHAETGAECWHCGKPFDQRTPTPTPARSPIHVPVFDYSQITREKLEKGDEFYEISVFKDGKCILGADELDSCSLPWNAVDDALALLDKHHADYVLVSVHGKQYPDGSPIPDGGIVFDSRSDVLLAMRKMERQFLRYQHRRYQFPEDKGHP